MDQTAGAIVGAVNSKNTDVEIGLQVIIQSWANLPEAVKSNILAIARASIGQTT